MNFLRAGGRSHAAVHRMRRRRLFLVNALRQRQIDGSLTVRVFLIQVVLELLYLNVDLRVAEKILRAQLLLQDVRVRTGEKL